MSSKRLQVRWEKHQVGVLAHLHHLLVSEAFVDVTLCCQGRRLRAHRVLLSASSPYLQKVLLEHPSTDHVTIILQDIQHEDMQSLLHFMYTGSVVVPQERIASFLRAAQTLDVKVLATSEQASGGVHISDYDSQAEMDVKASPNSPQDFRLVPRLHQNYGTDLRKINPDSPLNEHVKQVSYRSFGAVENSFPKLGSIHDYSQQTATGSCSVDYQLQNSQLLLTNGSRTDIKVDQQSPEVKSSCKFNDHSNALEDCQSNLRVQQTVPRSSLQPTVTTRESSCAPKKACEKSNIGFHVSTLLRSVKSDSKEKPREAENLSSDSNATSSVTTVQRIVNSRLLSPKSSPPSEPPEIETIPFRKIRQNSVEEDLQKGSVGRSWCTPKTVDITNDTSKHYQEASGAKRLYYGGRDVQSPGFPSHEYNVRVPPILHGLKSNLEEYYRRSAGYLQDKEQRGVHLVRPMPSLRPISHLAHYNGQVVPSLSPIKLSSYYVSDIVPELLPPARNMCVNGFQKPVFNLSGGLPVYNRIPPRLAAIVPPSPWSQHHRPPPAPRRHVQAGLGWALPPLPGLPEHSATGAYGAAFAPVTVNLTTRNNPSEAASPKLKQLLRGTDNNNKLNNDTNDSEIEEIPAVSRKRSSVSTPDHCKTKDQRLSPPDIRVRDDHLVAVHTSDTSTSSPVNDLPVKPETPAPMEENCEREESGTAMNLSCQGVVKVEEEVEEVLVLNDNNNNTGGKEAAKTHGCEDCGKNFSRRQLLLQHRRIHTGERPYTCAQCGKQFTQRGHWSTHQKLHEPARTPEHACPSCGKAFGTRASLKVHLRTHTGEKPFHCTECGKQFSQLRNYKYHRSVHEGTREFAATCPECGKYFNDRGYLSSHMKIHRNRKEYGCQYCGKSFNQRVAYNMHVRIHTGERPHSCPHCSKSFSRKMLLKQHLRIHTGEKPFACEVCGKAFADRSNMTLHMRLHSGIKPYSCSVCSKAFTKKHHLKTHMNYHTGIKPYACAKCGLRFSQSSNMRTHFKKCTGTGTNQPGTSSPPPASPRPAAVITPTQSDESSCGSNSAPARNGLDK